ncbi:PTS sugar transporter subunit IIA [Tetragenococcus koreensis]|uniref:PTS sugar transporter subunit IIA n=1 Tax=Tetragenococcus koreensis TaxID=290335 RepID=UPI000F4DFEED|nr:PTS sugar transporter subunit IIA [Tetragenococcus koreensis]MDN6630128.1 PTS sugar transporter subunit IIA [Staphylococcus equorum]AYW46569.1 PTS fructose transporter subunit IIA [Tetragenococcus koreensis]MCF1585603.1 PTS sugar transporter subunit IIA [Tetragenococcus koreensis]MCF1615201.1 PTS sugar transporter subunit IIA [Tetragenococcus koreensis]MCF1620232.1 PTS sugar transporter subunit IIA [Tetragenococcus koreensis]
MRKILIATHSTLASGALNSATFLIGNQSDISIIDAYVDETDYTQKIDQFFEYYNTEDEYVIFTDLFGGSVNQKIFTYKNNFEFFLITGFNLPILLEIILYNQSLTKEAVKQLVENCRKELQVVEVDSFESIAEDEESFL